LKLQFSGKRVKAANDYLIHGSRSARLACISQHQQERDGVVGDSDIREQDTNNTNMLANNAIQQEITLA
jgi:hypothetical protein